MIKELFIKWLVPFLCGGAVSAAGMLFTAIRFRCRKEKTLAGGVQCLLRAEIIRSYDKYTERKYCPLYAKEALTRAYDSYHKLGGNDVATDLYRQIMRLPTEKWNDKKGGLCNEKMA